MNVLIGANNAQLSPLTRQLLGRMLCPVTGLCQQIGFVMRSPSEPKIAVAGGDMTGVHVLRGLPAPRPGAYHIGGSGTTYEEAIISTLGETVERYAQHMAIVARRHQMVAASYEKMVADGCHTLVPPDLRYFSDKQLSRPGFPFGRLTPETVINWIPAQSLVNNRICWVPAELALVGYVRQPDEPQFMLGVSTGTAAHTKYDQALRRALLELIQIDAAMGHWYGRQEAVLIQHDSRTQVVYDLIKSRLSHYGPQPRFYLLPNADLPGLTVACVIEDQEVPRVVVGLSCDLRLSRSIYKAFLEAVAVAQLAKVILFRQSVEELPNNIAPSELYDLDLNVAYYGVLGPDAIRGKFGDHPARLASELPADVDLGVKRDLRYLVDGFAATGKELVFLDLTTSDIKSLGFCVTRVWSPDTISLSFPSAPPVMHQRFQAYGGVAHEAPHPYP